MTEIPCPFVYANGRRCKGTIYRAVAYGSRCEGHAHKYRLHCSEKGDHAGIVSSFEGKERMEFYPDELPEGVESLLWSGDASYDGKPLILEV